MKFWNAVKTILGNEGGFWGALALGAGLGLLKQKEDERAIRRANDAAAAQTEYSAISGMPMGRIQQAPSPWEGALQGAMAGAQFYGAGQNAGLWGANAAGMNGGQTIDPMASQAVGNMQKDVGAFGGGYSGSFQPNKQNPWMSQQSGLYS